jgi:hypothetical protein
MLSGSTGARTMKSSLVLILFGLIYPFLFLCSVSATEQENSVNLTMNEKVILAALIHQFKLTHKFDSSKLSGLIRLKESREQVVRLVECGKPYCELNIKLKEDGNFCVSGSKKLFSNRFLSFLTKEFKNQKSKFVYFEGNRNGLTAVEDDEIMGGIITPWKPETLCSEVHRVSTLHKEMDNNYTLYMDASYYGTRFHLSVTNDNHILYSTEGTWIR